MEEMSNASTDGIVEGVARHIYSLSGPQVEPEASYWAYNGRRIKVVEVDALPDTVIDPYETDPIRLDYEIQELQHLQELRGDLGKISGTFQAQPKQSSDPKDDANRTRLPLSKFFSLQPPPLGAIYNTSMDQPASDNLFEQCDLRSPILKTGEQLARMFEDETPGLAHRHALSCLLFRSNISPPRQARIWMALDTTIYSALLAAWHFKWANVSNGKADFSRVYRERPIEYECRVQNGNEPRFRVLYDFEVQSNGSGSGLERCMGKNVVSPGTPRHPAYPSGHSTYSAAASEVLKYFFRDAVIQQELDNLADNIGVARLWAGVHWRQDHTAGQNLGKKVAEMIIEQLQDDPVSRVMEPPDLCDKSISRPEYATVRRDSKKARDRTSPDPMQDAIPVDLNRPTRPIQGPNRGAS